MGTAPLSDRCLLQAAMAPGTVVIAIAVDSHRHARLTQTAQPPHESLLDHRLRPPLTVSDEDDPLPLTLLMGLSALLRPDATRATLGEDPPDILVDSALFHGRRGARLRGKKPILTHLQGLYPRARISPLPALTDGPESSFLRRLVAEHELLRLDELARQHFELEAIERSDREHDQLAHWLRSRWSGTGVVFTQSDSEASRLLETLRGLGLIVAELAPAVHFASNADGLEVFVLTSGRPPSELSADIEFVAHTRTPASLGAYAADLELVGHSRHRTSATIFYSLADLTRHSVPPLEAGLPGWPNDELIEDCVRARTCRHRMLLRQRHPQFPPPSPSDDPCNNCDNCRRSRRG